MRGGKGRVMGGGGKGHEKLPKVFPRSIRGDGRGDKKNPDVANSRETSNLPPKGCRRGGKKGRQKGGGEKGGEA